MPLILKNLLGISLDAIEPDAAAVGKLLAAAQRNLADAQLAGLSAENRFDAAYKAIRQLAMVALQANGYRTLTSKPGHHQTAIQTLTTSVGVAPAQVIVFDALRCAAQATQPIGLLGRSHSRRRGCRVPGQRAGASGACAGLAEGEPARPAARLKSLWPVRHRKHHRPA